MDRDELYKMTKIYKGESDPPCIGNLTSLLWSAEKLWVECELPPKLRDSEYLSYFTEDIEIMYNLLAELKKCSLIKFFNKKSCTIR